MTGEADSNVTGAANSYKAEKAGGNMTGEAGSKTTGELSLASAVWYSALASSSSIAISKE